MSNLMPGEEFPDGPFDAAIEAGWINPIDVSQAALDVLDERDRQWNEEGWTPDHDDSHEDGELALAAVCYAMPDYQANVIETVSFRGNINIIWRLWPFARAWWKPKDPRSNLVRAAALIIAEIERLDRAAAKAEPRS